MAFTIGDDYEAWNALRESERNSELGHRTRITVQQAEMDRLCDDPTFMMLLPAQVKAFGFTDKIWRDIPVDHIREVHWNKQAIGRVVLDTRKKVILSSLVVAHGHTTPGVDVIQGKGNALIILLHGSPGTGKTLTAESLAEYSRKPLYRVSSQELGVDPTMLETNLNSVLHLGSAWDCVVLLDEADVFLERRLLVDTKRNAVVAAFLRVLEYFDGILILTTNRVGAFEEAFLSRVSVTVVYPRLDSEGRRRVWNDILTVATAATAAQTEHFTSHCDELRMHVPELAEAELNGRQIRNVVHCAMQLAFHNKQRLSVAYLKDMIDIAGEFEQYIAGVHRGVEDNVIARRQGLRLEEDLLR